MASTNGSRMTRSIRRPGGQVGVRRKPTSIWPENYASSWFLRGHVAQHQVEARIDFPRSADELRKKAAGRRSREAQPNLAHGGSTQARALQRQMLGQAKQALGIPAGLAETHRALQQWRSPE